jgi:hypothetical protein
VVSSSDMSLVTGPVKAAVTVLSVTAQVWLATSIRESYPAASDVLFGALCVVVVSDDICINSIP